MKAIEGGYTTYYAADGSGVVTEFLAVGSGWQWQRNYVKWGDRLVATETANGLQYQHPDRLGTKLITDASGGVISTQASLPFGTALPLTSTLNTGEGYQSSSQPNPHQRRFTSYERSTTTNLDYAVNRHYAAEQGRFTQVDPIGMAAVSLENPQTLNLYAYCGKDPVNHTDPSGLMPKWLKRLLQVTMIAVSIFTAVTSVLAVFSAFSKAIQLANFLSTIGVGANATTMGIVKTAVYILGKNSIFHGLMALTQNAISVASNVASIFGKKLNSVVNFIGTIAGFLSGPLIVTKNITDAGATKKVADVGKTFDKWFNMATGTASQIADWADAKQASAIIGLVGIFKTLKST